MKNNTQIPVDDKKNNITFLAAFMYRKNCCLSYAINSAEECFRAKAIVSTIPLPLHIGLTLKHVGRQHVFYAVPLFNVNLEIEEKNSRQKYF